VVPEDATDHGEDEKMSKKKSGGRESGEVRRTADAVPGSDTGAGSTPAAADPAALTEVWIVETGTIVATVLARNQWEAFDALRSFDKNGFGLIVVAKRAYSAEGEEYAVRTSRLMGRWGRVSDALEFINLAIEEGLPDTSREDLNQVEDSQ